MDRRLYVAEYAAPLDDAAALTLRRCFEVREVRWVKRYRLEDREWSVLEAESADFVRGAHRSAEVAFVGVWPAEELAIPG